MKNAFDEVISTLGMAEERSSEPDDASVEIIFENKYWRVSSEANLWTQISK